jgi:hypothetical protein
MKLYLQILEGFSNIRFNRNRGVGVRFSAGACVKTGSGYDSDPVVMDAEGCFRGSRAVKA